MLARHYIEINDLRVAFLGVLLKRHFALMFYTVNILLNRHFTRIFYIAKISLEAWGEGGGGEYYIPHGNIINRNVCRLSGNNSRRTQIVLSINKRSGRIARRKAPPRIQLRRFLVL